MRIPRALTIAGSDSGGGAGIQADLKTFAAFGVYGVSAIAALTSQNTLGVHGVVEIDPDFVSSQIRAVVSDIGVDAVKTGMLANAAIITRVAKDVEELGIKNLIVDPVMISKSGDRLLRRDAMDALVTKLLPLALVVTPNLHEASELAGMEARDNASMRQAAVRIHAFGPRYVLIKGGHLPEKPMDILYDGNSFREFTAPRFDTIHTHGTGCTFASAIAAAIALDLSVSEAIEQAKAYITGAIRKGLPLGKGQGPVHHFYELYRLAGARFPWNL